MAFVSQRSSSSASSSDPVVADFVGLASSSAAGDHLVLIASFNTDVGAVAVTDTAGNTWNVDLVALAPDNSMSIVVASAYLTFAVVVGDTVNVSWENGATVRCYMLEEINGRATSAWLDSVFSNSLLSDGLGTLILTPLTSGADVFAVWATLSAVTTFTPVVVPRAAFASLNTQPRMSMMMMMRSGPTIASDASLALFDAASDAESQSLGVAVAYKAAVGTRPQIQDQPIITPASVVEGTPETVSNGRWLNVPSGYTYQWQASPDLVTWTNIVR